MSPILPIVLLLAFGAAAAADDSVPGIVGTWEFVSATETAADGSTTKFTEYDLRSTKILNETHFCVVTRNADGSFRHSNLGPYRLEGHLYTEILEYSTDRRWTGAHVVYSYRIEGDLWYIDTSGFGYPKRGEVWRRVEEARAPVEF